MNSLTDRDVIDKIVEACNAGVKVILVIRGITCIVDVDEQGEGLIIRQIVGRFLEHARVYAFGAEVDTVYLSSADMMTRNTEHRVEIAYPVLDPICRALVLQYMNIQLADNVKARQLTREGTWEKVAREEGAPLVDSQQSLIVLSYDRARKARDNQDVPLVPEASVVPPIPEVLHGAPVSEVIVAESTEEDQPELEVASETPIPADAFDNAAEKAETSPVPSFITQAQERAQERIEARKTQLSQQTQQTQPAQQQTRDESAPQAQQAQPQELAPVPAKSQGRWRKAFGLFGEGLRELVRRR